VQIGGKNCVVFWWGVLQMIRGEDAVLERVSGPEEEGMKVMAR